MHTSVERHDAVVVGVGGMGSAATYHLARRGVDVVGIERFDVPHTRGSSHGGSRIVRLVQHEDPSYVPLARRALDRYRELETATGRDLLTITGSIHAGAPGTGIVADATAACEAHDVPYERLSAAEVNERFPGYDLPEGFESVYQPDGGFVDPERAVAAHVEAAIESGGTVRARERVLDWHETGDGVRVKTDKGRYAADNLVVAAGAWAGKLVADLEPALTPVRRVMAWLQPNTPELFQPDRFPVFSLRGDDESGYGFPIHETPGFKFGRSPSNPAAVDPDDFDPEPSHAEEELLRRFATRYFPDGAGPTLKLAPCVLTESGDGDFLLGHLPGHDAVTVAAGFTGHGFKFTTVVGEALADFVTDGDTDAPIDVHRIERL
jgi:sarcosine oxidase